MIAEKTELLVREAGWIDAGQANGLDVATVRAGEATYSWSRARVTRLERQRLRRFSRHNFDFCVGGCLPLISRDRAEAGESIVRPVPVEKLHRSVTSSGRSAHNLLRLVSPLRPDDVTLHTLLPWVVGIGSGFGVVTTETSKALTELVRRNLETDAFTIKRRRYYPDTLTIRRRHLHWWTLSDADRETLYRMALVIRGRPGYRGARIERVAREDFDTLQWCAVACGAHARLDVHGGLWLTPGRPNPAMYRGLCVDKRLGTAYEITATGETALTRYRGEISAQYLTG